MCDKLELIREIEKEIGFVRFNVNKKSSEVELDDVLGFIRTIQVMLEEVYVPKINKILKED